MSKPRSERSRWTQVFVLPYPSGSVENAQAHHDQALAVVRAFARVGRVVRLEANDYSKTLILKARKA